MSTFIEFRKRNGNHHVTVNTNNIVCVFPCPSDSQVCFLYIVGEDRMCVEYSYKEVVDCVRGISALPVR